MSDGLDDVRAAQSALVAAQATARAAQEHRGAVLAAALEAGHTQAAVAAAAGLTAGRIGQLVTTHRTTTRGDTMTAAGRTTATYHPGRAVLNVRMVSGAQVLSEHEVDLDDDTQQGADAWLRAHAYARVQSWQPGAGPVEAPDTWRAQLRSL